jgi:heme oxygenase
MVAYVYDYITRRNPVGFFGMVFVLEGTSAAIALHAADAIERALELPTTALRYLRSHGETDREHVRYLAALVDRHDCDEDRASVLHVARVVYRLYADVFRALPRATATEEIAS